MKNANDKVAEANVITFSLSTR